MTKQVLDVVSLIELVEHGLLGVVAHAGRTDLVDTETRCGRRTVCDLDVLRTRRLEHLAGLRGGVGDELPLVVAKRHVDVERRECPSASTTSLLIRT